VRGLEGSGRRIERIGPELTSDIKKITGRERRIPLVIETVQRRGTKQGDSKEGRNCRK